MRPTEPILQNLHILQRGGLSKLPRSGFCQGGLTSDEVSRKIELQRDNYNLMSKLSRVSLRKNGYVNCNSRSGKMMSRQTRLMRQKRDLEKANLGMYLQIVSADPSVTPTQ